jgi:putative ABC transport system substrate-binding protein
MAQGIVASMSHPGGNATGFARFEASIGGKWLGLLKSVSPGLSRVAAMFHPDEGLQVKLYVQAIEDAAPSFGVRVVTLPVRSVADIEQAMARFADVPNGGLILPTGTFTRVHQTLIVDLASRFRLPSISPIPGFAGAGGLMEYGIGTANIVSEFDKAAGYVDRILKGAKPGDLPVQGSDRYQFLISIRTAKRLAIEIPSGILAIADAVIE